MWSNAGQPVGQQACVAAIAVGQPQVHPVTLAAIARTHVGERLSIRRPRGFHDVEITADQDLFVATVDIHREQYGAVAHLWAAAIELPWKMGHHPRPVAAIGGVVRVHGPGRACGEQYPPSVRRPLHERLQFALRPTDLARFAAVQRQQLHLLRFTDARGKKRDVASVRRQRRG